MRTNPSFERDTGSVSPTELNVILRITQVQARIGLSRSSIYLRLDPKSPFYDDTFPKPVRLGVNSRGFIQSEVDAWIESLILARDELAPSSSELNSRTSSL